MNESEIHIDSERFHVIKTKKFLFGVFLLISNFVVGKIAIVIIPFSMLAAVLVYLFSWLMLFAGLFLCGKDGYEYAKVSYKFFKHKMRQNALSGIKAMKHKEH